MSQPGPSCFQTSQKNCGALSVFHSLLPSPGRQRRVDVCALNTEHEKLRSAITLHSNGRLGYSDTSGESCLLDSTRPLCTQAHPQVGRSQWDWIFPHKMLSILLHEHTVIILEFNHPFLCPGISCFICKTTCVL